MRVKEIMTKKPSYCEPYWTVEAVASLMDHVGTGILPVVEGIVDQHVVGVVTDRDLCVRVVGPGLYPAHTWVRDCMTAQPVCCRPDDDIGFALRLMKEKQVRRVPVVSDGMQLLGMLSISDFVRSDVVAMQSVYSALKQICEARTEPVPSSGSIRH